MSLLLDALKKAAEQKADKTREESREGRSSDETVLKIPGEDVSELEQADEALARLARRTGRDETELDHSERNTRLEQGSQRRDQSDETGLDAPAEDDTSLSEIGRSAEAARDKQETELEIAEETITQAPSLSDQMRTGEDETIIFAEEDVADFMGEPSLIKRDSRPAEDETDLSQVVESRDDTQLKPTPPGEDETDLSKLLEEEDVSRVSAAPSGEDDTDLSKLAEDEDGSHVSVAPPNEDDTDLSKLVEDEEDSPASLAPSVEDETDISQAYKREDESPPVATRSVDDEGVEIGGEDESLPQDDMSLMLVDRDDTDISSRTSATDPRRRGQFAGQAGADTDAEGLVDQPEMTSTRVADADSTTNLSRGRGNESTLTRADSTSTRTYAPDNYDRTLMKLPSEDASKLFAGMKAEADVVMTPDYAKKVFQSKSSAQRVQHYKIYSGIAVVILLTIGVFGLFEYQSESDNIDFSLQPLKRDPMPGLIKQQSDRASSSLFANTASEEVDSRTLELIESAQTQSQGVIASAETEPAATTNATAAVEVPAQGGSNTANQTASLEPQASAPAKPKPAKPAGVAEVAGKPASTLQITSSKRLEEKSQLLGEAYAAYQAGNDGVALDKYNQVLKLDPGNRNGLLARAAINLQNGNSSVAIRDYQTLLLANPKDSLAMTSLVSLANFSPEETESQLKLMIRDEPNSPYLNFALANVYGAQNRWQEAQGLYFKALENNPGDANYAYNLAVSLEHIARPQVAIAYYQRALDNFELSLATFSRDVVNQRLELLRNL